MPRYHRSRSHRTQIPQGPGRAPSSEAVSPLDRLPAGASGVVHALRGGKSATSRLAVMGFTPGSRVTVLQNRGWGPMIVMTRDVRLALGRGLAHKIEIAPPPPSR